MTPGKTVLIYLNGRLVEYPLGPGAEEWDHRFTKTAHSFRSLVH
jgi:hypothetical protein